MSRIVFYDPSCSRPYDSDTLRNSAMGGSESTLVRIADWLGATVTQHNRTESHDRYLVPHRCPITERVVVNRDSRALPAARVLYPHARIYLWLHDRVSPGSKRARWLASTADVLLETATHIVCVSEYQRSEVIATLESIGLRDRLNVSTIYNPVDDSLLPNGTSVDPDKLVVANPGYKADLRFDIEGVTRLGAQPLHRLHAHVRSALATFAPNWQIPETFGLVYAESLALGTPVLTHDCGAAMEIIDDSRQVLAIPRAARAYETVLGGFPPKWRRFPAAVAGRWGMFDEYVERLRSWRNGDRPQVGPDPRFRLAHVADQWIRLLS